MLDFSKLTQYNPLWTVSDSRNFNDNDKALIASARVVSSDYGLSVCFLMRNGHNTFVPLSKMSTLKAGDTVDINTAKILTLSKEGEEDIYRIDA